MPFIIPVPGNDLPGVLTYRDLDDVNAMLLAAQSRAKAVVIGGGLLGLEAAAGLNERGMDVTVLHVMPTLMERQLDPAAGYLLQRAVEARGIKVDHQGQHQGDRRQRQGRKASSSPTARSSRRRWSSWRSASGPISALAKEAGLAVNRGIVVDARHAHLRSRSSSRSANAPRSAATSTASSRRSTRWRASRPPAWPATSSARFVHSDTPTKLKVTGIDLYSLGDFADGDDREEIVLRDASAGIYKRLVLQDEPHHRHGAVSARPATAPGSTTSRRSRPTYRRCATR